MNNMKNIKNIKGITLVSLVITIVIMLILAGVTISLVIGNNGLFNKSKVAASKYNDKALIEQIENIWNEYVTDSTSKDVNEPITLAGFTSYVTDNNLLEISDQTDDNLNIKLQNRMFAVEKNGVGISVSKVGDLPKKPEVVDTNYYIYKDGEGVENWDLVNTVRYSPAGDVTNVNNCLDINAQPTGLKGIRVNTATRFNTRNYTKLCVKYDIDTRINSSDSYSYFYVSLTSVDQTTQKDWWANSGWYTDPGTKNVFEKGDEADRTDQILEMDISDIPNQDRYLVLTSQGLHVKIHSVWFE